MSETTRLRSASNMIDNTRWFLENEPTANLLQEAKNARMAWGLFSEEFAAQLLAAGQSWDQAAAALGLSDVPAYQRDLIEHRAEQLRAERAVA